MKVRVSEKRAAFTIVFLLSLVVLFHVLVIINVIPDNVTWGSKVKDHKKLIQLEWLSVFVNIIFITIAAVRVKWLIIPVRASLLKALLWAMAILFLLNTLGNLLSENPIERFAFSPVTFLLSYFSLRLAKA